MSGEIIFLLIFVVIMFFMHRGHGHGKGGCGRNSHKAHSQRNDQISDEVNNENTKEPNHH
jgi:hypothetical protein